MPVVLTYCSHDMQNISGKQKFAKLPYTLTTVHAYVKTLPFLVTVLKCKISMQIKIFIPCIYDLVSY